MSKILIVEDEKAQREALKEKFERAGHTVLATVDGEEAFEICLKEKPDGAILDVMLPGMTGLEMAKKLREDEWGKNLKIVILSNMDRMENVQSAMEAGVYDYFIKSDTPLEEIVSKVESLLE